MIFWSMQIAVTRPILKYKGNPLILFLFQTFPVSGWGRICQDGNSDNKAGSVQLSWDSTEFSKIFKLYLNRPGQADTPALAMDRVKVCM